MYKIRLATKEDIPLLPSIEQAACDLFLLYEITANLPLHLTALEEFYQAQKDHRLWVATYSEGAPIGFALVEMLDNMAHLEELDVIPTHGRKGVGTQLLKTVIEWARFKAITAVTLTTFREIPWNAPFYQKIGFRILEPSELKGELKDRVMSEENAGLPQGLRVVMRYDIT